MTEDVNDTKGQKHLGSLCELLTSGAISEVHYISNHTTFHAYDFVHGFRNIIQGGIRVLSAKAPVSLGALIRYVIKRM